MNIDSGLFDHMVLQRVKNFSDAVIHGRCEGDGPVMAKVYAGGKVLKGIGRLKIGTAANRRFRARLKGIPVGGPYEIELAIGQEKLTVRDVLVGDVWLLGGQSNMEGLGLLRDALPPKSMTRAFYMDDHWGIARDPLHQLHLAVDAVHGKLGAARTAQKITGVGPGVPFAQEMLRRTGVPQGLIACAHGGTRMDQWDPARQGDAVASPALKKLKGASLYGAAIRRFVKNGGRVAGLVWYQGESDADAARAGAYTQKMIRFLRALRKDVGNPRLPVAMVQIARVVNWPAGCGSFWNSIQEQQRRLPDRIGNLAVVPAIDLPIDDTIHLSGVAMKSLGVRLAEAMLNITGDKSARAPIALDSCRLKNSRPGIGEVHVKFSNVVGKLVANSRPVGFSLGTPLPAAGVFDVNLHGPTAVVRTMYSVSNLRGMTLYYGPGPDPVCNIIDQANRSLPVLGPIALGKARAVTPFIRRLRVSGFLPSAGKLHGLACPDVDAMRMKERLFPADFCDLHVDIAARGGADELVVYACRFECPEPMRLKLELGYDGPVKAWVDGREVFHDPTGINPANPTDKGCAIFRVGAGQHELVVGLGTNFGGAWGVFLRMERLDVPQRKVKLGPTAYQMPRLLG
jgi:hypothetical protein